MQKGYVQVYTGDGKGKTTAALGLALRAAGAGMRVYIGQYLKQGCYNELESLKRYSDQVVIEQFGTGQYVFGDPTDEDRRAAANAFESLKNAVMSGGYDVVIMEEANVALGYGLITEDELFRVIDERPVGVEIVITGRGATPALIDKADLVTEMKAVKHYYEQGVLARTGIES